MVSHYLKLSHQEYLLFTFAAIATFHLGKDINLFYMPKLHAYGFSREALTLINDYLTNRQQRVKVNGSFSS